ncbi:MAG: hypothetical protein AAF682_04150 [Planctomycetota bacterium]
MRIRSVLFALLALAGWNHSQCLLFDGLNGPCCSSVTPALPAFPAVTMPGLSVCWDACVPSSQSCSDVQLSPPTQLLCGQYQATFDTSECGTGLPELTGVLELDYTRSWDEFPTPGQVIQVWRFVVRADLMLAGTASGCPIPDSFTTYPTAFYYGYLDYAFDCSSGTWESALALYHACDAFLHDPAISSQPGVFNPARSFALVAPSTVTNPFIPGIAPAGGGPLLWEGIRDTVDLASLACEVEEPLAGGLVLPLGSACACPFSTAQPQVTARVMEGSSTCGSDFRSLNLFPIFPWVHVMSTSLGRWSNGSSYPGPEAVWVDEGLFLHTEACQTPQVFAEIKVGATTEGGYLATVGPAVGDKFTDLVSNFSVPITSPVAPPFVGNVFFSRHLVYFNYL